MKTLYLECNMGAAGDMLMAALLELVEEKQAFVDKMNGLGIPGVTVGAKPAEKCGIRGTHVSVTVDGKEETSEDVHTHSHEEGHGHSHEHAHGEEHTHIVPHPHMHEEEHGHHHQHSHSSMESITHLITHLPVSDKVKANATAVYELIAQAESKAHGKPVSQVHFHEVGAMDAVADVVGFCLLMEQLSPDRVIASPVHVGSGFVRCAHGVLPVPAPATAHILQGVPIYGGQVQGELCTPTGAALLRHFADSFGPMPIMNPGKIGYGMGKKDFETANCVRAFLGEDGLDSGPNGEIAELRCNLDDMTGEELGYASRILFEEGALDVCTIPVQMKKNRPGHMLLCICKPGDTDRMARLMLRHTTTLGVRKTLCTRYMLERECEEAETSFGVVRIKRASGYGVTKLKPEYDGLARIAQEQGISLKEAREAVSKEF
mgnify:CR=1 FL=1